ncbi:hypothetical protein GCM10009641_09520 [Mycobacterium cookii]|uniref:Trypsin n=1 Tax=Mycobacterium cookii TaxID=1775 RepID=A0A7I7L1Q7_9MYCO|nr:serine protease [Mycobacterium cookii]MCV7329861.1 trypsin-like peptidase domain-containing protein [Mycobacterium cookii]BBX48004.1 hypothetical protein MCOO_40190 [Mycobacterium cookii]
MHRWSALLSTCAIAVLLESPGVALADDGRPQATPTEKAAALIRPALVELDVHAAGRVRLPNGDLLVSDPAAPFEVTWHCSGFIVNPDGWVATAGHCADPDSARSDIISAATSVYVSRALYSPDAQGPLPTSQWLRENARIEGTAPDQVGPQVTYTVNYGSGTDVTTASASLADFRPLAKGDVALLKMDKHHLPSSELAPDSQVEVGEAIVAVGFPHGTDSVIDSPAEPTSKNGTISRKATKKGIPEYEIDAAVSNGMSGGPVANLDGKVLGLVSFSPTLELQPFNFVAPADPLAVLMAAKGVKATLGPADSVYRRGLDAYYAGRYTDAIGDFDQTLLMSPGYPGAAKFRTDAANLRQQFGDASSFNWPVIWYAAGGFVLLLGLGLIVSRRRRRRTPAGAIDLKDWEPSYIITTLPDGSVEPAALPAASAGEPFFCAECGAVHHHDERFCPNCGSRIALLENRNG